MKTPANWNNRIILIVPGVTGCSGDRYIHEVVHAATRGGYRAIVLNHLAPKYCGTSNIRCNDFSRPETFIAIFQFIEQQFPDCEGIYGMGYSLGANYILKAAGSDPEHIKFKGFAAVSPPFDVCATVA